MVFLSQQINIYTVGNREKKDFVRKRVTNSSFFLRALVRIHALFTGKKQVFFTVPI